MRVTRRRFLHGTAIATASVAFSLPSRTWAFSANESVRVAVIGLNGRGRSHLDGFGASVVAVCDVDRTVLSRCAARLKQRVDAETDFRRLLDRKDIDAVSIATPNHTHSWIAVLAAQAGKDVYVEKPVSHNVWEGRQLVNAARKYDRIIQCGTQSRSSPSLKQAVAWVRDGNLGRIRYALGTCYKPRHGIGKLDAPLVIPPSIDYDLWCGPAPLTKLYRPRLHYDWHWDFATGNGDMGNQGIHQMDIARWFLGETTLSPRVMSIGGRLGYSDAGDTPNTLIVYHAYERAPLIFETRGLPASKAGQKNWGASMDAYRGSQVGVIIQCENGHVLVPSYTSAIALDKRGQVIKKWSGGGDHYANFIAAVRSRKRSELNADILEGHLSSGLCHTGNISYRIGNQAPAKEITQQAKSNPLAADSFQRMAAHLEANGVDIDKNSITLGPWLEMDTAAERFSGNDHANRLLGREYRKSYVVPRIEV